MFVRLAVFRARDRFEYEKNLRAARDAADAAASEAYTRLNNEQEVSQLREQFIAVLGHDLRNPLAAIDGGINVLGSMSLGERAQAVLALLSKSSGRMACLISDVMDFARGRLGSGLSMERRAANVGPVLNHVVDELQAARPDRRIVKSFDLAAEVHCDAPRIAQLLSNLLANALTHGDAHGTVLVEAISTPAVFEFCVVNTGPAIPADILPTLFEPFSREATRPSRQGLGLGLFIAAEIARGHGANLSVASDDQETRFTFRMPVDQ